MKKLLVLFLVAAMCIPSYGSILVYKTLTTTAVLDEVHGTVTTQAQNSYLVLDVNLATQTINAAQQVNYWGTGASKQQQTVVVTVVFHNPTGYIVADYSSGYTDAVLVGKTILTDIGLGSTNKKPVANTLSGYLLVYEESVLDGTGSMIATLDVATTKAANLASRTLAQAVAAIAAVLTSSGYHSITDVTAPTPNPMRWDVNGAHTAISDTRITMSAALATDANSPPVQYKFLNKTDSNHNSGWKSASADSSNWTASTRTWIDTSLTPRTKYTYTVMAEDSAPVPNPTGESNEANATTSGTPDTNAPTPNPMRWAIGGEPNATSATTIQMTAALATDLQGVEYEFLNKTDPNHNSGWLSATTNSTNWTASTRTWTDTGLIPDVCYGYTVKAHDLSTTYNETNESNVAYATTWLDVNAPTPNPMTFDIAPYAVGASSIKMRATTASDTSPPVQYQFWRVSPYGESRMFGWQTDPNFTDTGLDGYTYYSYEVRAKDSSVNANTTDWSTEAVARTTYTMQELINNAIASGYSSVTIPAGLYNEDLEINSPINFTVKSAAGKASTTIQLKTNGNGIKIDKSGCTIGGSYGHGFTIIGNDTNTNYAIFSDQNSTEVSYCDINTVGHAQAGIAMPAGSTVTIKSNTFYMDSTTDSGVYFYQTGGVGTLKHVLISGNTFDSVGSPNSVWLGGADCNDVNIAGNTTDCSMYIGVGPNSTMVTHLNICGNNTFTNGSGIYLYELVAGNDANRLNNVTITNNTFAAGSTKPALLIPDNTAFPGGSSNEALETTDIDWTTLTFTHNSVLRTPGGIYHSVDNMIGASAVLNAVHNWWGDASGPVGGCDCSIGASISNNSYVTFQKFYTNSAMTTDANCIDIGCSGP